MHKTEPGAKRPRVSTLVKVILAVGLWITLGAIVLNHVQGGRFFMSDSMSGSIREVWIDGLTLKEEMLYQSATFNRRDAIWTLGADDNLGRLHAGQWLVMTTATARVAIKLQNADWNYRSVVLRMLDNEGKDREIRPSINLGMGGIEVGGSYLMWIAPVTNSIDVFAPGLYPGRDRKTNAVFFPVTEEFAREFTRGNTNPPKWFRFPGEANQQGGRSRAL
jgi:hypothetical protein